MTFDQYIAACQALRAAMPSTGAMPVCVYDGDGDYNVLTKTPEIHEGQFGLTLQELFEGNPIAFGPFVALD